MAYKLPGAETVSGPGSFRPSGNIAVADPSGLIEGINAVAAGGSRLGGALAQRADLDRQRQSASQLSQAEAKWVTGSLALQDGFERDPDWRTFTDRATQGTDSLKAEAAALISDPVARGKWLDDVTIRQAGFVNSIGDQGRKLEEGEYRSNLEGSLDATTNLITDPTMSDPVRKKARQNIEGSIAVAENLGMVTKAEGNGLREKYLRGADTVLDWNRAQLDLTFRPDYVLGNIAITQNMGSGDLAAAISAGTGGQPIMLDPALAGEVADRLGDTALPSDEKLRAAYLTDPEQNARYVGAALDMLTDRYKGDMTAAVIAMAPGGGAALADQWVKSGHDESKLPPAVRKVYRSVIEGMAPAGSTAPLPTIAAPGVNVEGLNVGVLDRWEVVQGAFGTQLPVISAARTAEHNAEVGGASHSRHVEGRDAIDIDTSSLSKEDVVRLIQTASSQGFTGIGVYGNSIHLDLGERRAWGPSYKSASVPAWAKDAIDLHLAGDAAGSPPVGKAVAPEYRNLSFDQRLKIYDQAKVAVAQKGLDMKSGLEITAQNAPVAIANTGTYDRPLPTAEDYVAAYGASEGIERYKAFDASVDVANKAYGMRTMSSQDISAMVQGAVPTSTGDMAAIEQKSFDTLATAAQTVLKQREEDPAGYAMQTYPAVADAWKEAQESKDPVKFSQAIARTALAQEVLGVSNPQLLPKELAKSTVDAFNNAEAPQSDRINAAVSTVFATNDQGQQEAIYRQLTGAGMPKMTQPAFAALSRGDTAAAEYLFKASMFNPKDYPGAMPAKDTEIQQRISEKLLDQNQVGDVVYGLSDGTADNYGRLADDGALMTNAVKLRLLDGSATSLDQAIDMVSRDMWGDVEVVTGKPSGGGAGVKILMQKGEDKSIMLDGFNALLPTVGDAILADLTPSMAGAITRNAPPPGPTGQQPGMVAAGNLDLAARPQVKNADGSISTVRSMSFEEDGVEVLIPTVAADGSGILSDEAAIDQYRKTGQYLGKFDSPDAASTYAENLHKAQEQYYGWRDKTGSGETAILTTARDFRVSDMLSEGYFTAQGNEGYVFVDPMTGQAVPNPNGDGPLIFSRDAVMEASAGARASGNTAAQKVQSQGLGIGWGH